jgi:hypothetical protein
VNVATIWLCGWALGTLAIHKAATRIWNNPERHRQLVMLRSAANQPTGILAFALSAFMFWWVFVLAIPWDVWRDTRWRPEQDGDDDV